MAEKVNQEIEIEKEDNEEIVVEETRRSTSGGYVKTDLSQYFNTHKKLVTYVAGGILGLIVLLLGYRFFYVEPMNAEAREMLYKAQRQFERDSFNLALYGTPDAKGMMEIADDYGPTDAGNLAAYYAGMSLLHQGKFQEAIDYLKDFNSESIIVMPLALGGIGDAYVQLKNYDEAASYYNKAADKSENEFTTPMFLKKAGLVYEKLGEYDRAVTAYQKIKDKYPRSTAGNSIDKYLARAKAASDTK